MCCVVLGIDPGINKTGFGLIKYSKNTPFYITSGVLKTKASDSYSVRLSYLFESLKRVIENYNPDVISVEETFVNKNPSSSLTLGYARSVILILGGIFKIPVFEYSPNHIKKTITGNGHANKDQVMYMVRKLLSVNSEIKYSDESDALAIALTYRKNNYNLK